MGNPFLKVHDTMMLMQEEGSPQSTAPDQPESSWQFNPETQPSPGAPSNLTPAKPVSAVAWTASEFIAHDKSPQWFLALGGGTAIVALLIFVLTRDKVSTSMVIVVAIIFGVFAARKPRELPYVIDDSGVHIGEKLYPFSGFKSFSLVQEDALQAVWLMPLKRFMPIITVYFSPGDAEKIVGALSGTLPLENRQPDLVDKLMHRLRF